MNAVAEPYEFGVQVVFVGVESDEESNDDDLGGEIYAWFMGKLGVVRFLNLDGETSEGDEAGEWEWRG